MLLEWKGTGLGKQTKGTRGALHTEGQDLRNVTTSTFYTKGFSKGGRGDREGWEEGKVGEARGKTEKETVRGWTQVMNPAQSFASTGSL